MCAEQDPFHKTSFQLSFALALSPSLFVMQDVAQVGCSAKEMMREEAMVLEWSSDPHPADTDVWDSGINAELQNLRTFIEGHPGSENDKGDSVYDVLDIDNLKVTRVAFSLSIVLGLFVLPCQNTPIFPRQFKEQADLLKQLTLDVRKRP